MKKLIIGLTGSMGCGKGEIVKILEKKGFLHITLSEMVKEEAKRRGVGMEREILMKIGNSMRKKEGAKVLAKKALKKILSSENERWVVDGIRNPAEIDELRKTKNVHIVGVHTSLNLLVDRIFSRGRTGDTKDRDETIHKIEREWGKGEASCGQQVGKCMKKVDVTIENCGTLKELTKKFINYYNLIKK